MHAKRSHGTKIANALLYVIEAEHINGALSESLLAKLANPLPLYRHVAYLEPFSVGSAYVLHMKGIKVPIRSLAVPNVFLVLSNWRIVFQMQIPYMQTYVVGWQYHDMLKSILAKGALRDAIIEIEGEYTPLTNTIIVREADLRVHNAPSRVLLQAATQPPPHYRNLRYALAALLAGGTIEYNEVRNKLVFVSIHHGLICLKNRAARHRSCQNYIRIEFPLGVTWAKQCNAASFKADVLVPTGFSPYVRSGLPLPRVMRNVSIDIHDLAPVNTDDLKPGVCLDGIIAFITEYNYATRDINTSIVLVYVNDVLSERDVGLLNFYKTFYYIATMLALKSLEKLTDVSPKIFKRIRTALGEAVKALYALRIKYALEVLNDALKELRKLDCIINSHELERFDPDMIQIGPRRTRQNLLRELNETLALRLQKEDIYDLILRPHCVSQTKPYRCPNLYLTGLYHTLKSICNTLSSSSGELSPQLLQYICLKLICTNRLIEDRGSLVTLSLEKIMLARKLVGGDYNASNT